MVRIADLCNHLPQTSSYRNTGRWIGRGKACTPRDFGCWHTRARLWMLQASIILPLPAAARWEALSWPPCGTSVGSATGRGLGAGRAGAAEAVMGPAAG